MITETIKQTYAKCVKQGLKPIILFNHETGVVFVSLFSLEFYKQVCKGSIFVKQLEYTPE